MIHVNSERQGFTMKFFSKDSVSEKINDLIAQTKLNDLIHRKEKKNNGIVIALAIIGSVAAVAVIAFLVYKWVNPKYIAEFDDLEDEDDIDEDDIDGGEA